MNWLYQKNGKNSSVFQNIAKYSPLVDYDRVLNNVSFTGASSWDDLLLKWIEGVANGEVEGANIEKQEENNNVNLYPGAIVAYNGTLSSSDNLVTRKLSSGLELALNKDIYIGYTPTSISITIPKASSIQASKMYKKVSSSRKSPVKTYAKIKVIISKKLRLSLTYVIAQEKRI